LSHTYEDNSKQILVVAFFFFPIESSESSCLKIVKNTIIEAYWISGKPFFMKNP
jgi:hypothetical protein